MRLGNSLVESLALSGGNVELELGGLARTVAGREGTCAPGRAAVDLVEVGEHGYKQCISNQIHCLKTFVKVEGMWGLTECSLISQRNIDESVVRKRAHASNSSALLSTTKGTSRDEHARVLAPERALRPLLAGLVPEGLELCWEVAVTRGDAEEDAVKGLKLGGVLEDADVGLGGRVHLGEDILGEGLGDSKEGR